MYFFKCDQCQAALEHDGDIAGEQVQCPDCSAVFRLDPSGLQSETSVPRDGKSLASEPLAKEQRAESRVLWGWVGVAVIFIACVAGWLAMVYSQAQAERVSARLQLSELERGIQSLDYRVAQAERQLSEFNPLEAPEALDQSRLRQAYLQARCSHYANYVQSLKDCSAGHAARDHLRRATQLDGNYARLLQEVEAGLEALGGAAQVQTDAQFKHYRKPFIDWVLSQADRERAEILSWLRLDDEALVATAYFEQQVAQLAKREAEAARLAHAKAEAARLAQAQAEAEVAAKAAAARLAQAQAAAQRLEQQWQDCLRRAPLPLILVPAGSFQMGGYGIGADEQPVHEVRLTRRFGLGQTEVTQSQYEAVMGKNPSRFKGASLPVERVSWSEAVTYCARLTARERAAGRLPAGFEYTLPTEAEWEYACRGGTTGGFSGNLDHLAWYQENSSGSPHPVGQKQPNAWGLYDMHGNVWEWCSDGYGAYPSVTVTDPCGANNTAFRVLRGGGWRDLARNCRSALRGRATPRTSGDFLGFRVALRSPE